MPPPRPPFDSLPLQKDGPPGNCWGLFGADDELGQLNYITAEVTREAAKEIQSGVHVSVNLPLDFVQPPTFSRTPLEHKLIRHEHPAGYDDDVKFNTQVTKKTKLSTITRPTIRFRSHIGSGFKLECLNTEGWVENGGIATRGVLLDYHRWATSQSVDKPIFERSSITASELRAVAESQGVTFRQGDVLMVRTGFLAAYTTMSVEDRAEKTSGPQPKYIGLESAPEVAKFVWENGIVAAATDSPAFETWPVDLEASGSWLHHWLLAGWGCPIGEYFDLERLAEECEKAEKWTFFFTSMPLNVSLLQKTQSRKTVRLTRE